MAENIEQTKTIILRWKGVEKNNNKKKENFMLGPTEGSTGHLDFYTFFY